jgi:hypothetical protein
MRLLTRFFTGARPGAKPALISNAWGEFAAPAEARDQAFLTAGAPKMVAESFTIEGEDGALLEHWILQGASWEKGDA